MIFTIDLNGTLCVDTYPAITTSWSAAQGLTFDAINDNLPDMIELYGNNCRKVFADGYIDDRNVRDLLGVEI